MANPGFIPQKNGRIVSAIKSLFSGQTISGDGVMEDWNGSQFTEQNVWQRLSGIHIFSRRKLTYLVETGYVQNPPVFGLVNKILLAQRNIIFQPYLKGKPIKNKTIDLDLNFALQMLLLTGTIFINRKKVIGFDDKFEVLNTLRIQEAYRLGTYTYTLEVTNGVYQQLITEDLIIIKFADIVSVFTQMGISPLQAALMPIEALREMYTADTATLKNKGVDVIITNDSDVPLLENENESFDEAINKRVRGSRKAGGVATSTAKLRVLNLGRSTKELALWDGFKIKTRDICNVFQVDSGQLNDPDNKKFANVQESNKALYSDCVIPFTKLISENKDLVKALGYDIYLDVAGIDCLQESQQTRFEKNTTITNAIINLNAQVSTGILSYEIAIKILVSEWNMNEEEAADYIKYPDKKTSTSSSDPNQEQINEEVDETS